MVGCVYRQHRMRTVIRTAVRSRTSPLSPRGRLWFDLRGSELRCRLWCRSSSRNLLAFPLRSFVYRAPTRLCRLWGSIFDWWGWKRKFRHWRSFVLSNSLPNMKSGQNKNLESSYLGRPIRSELASCTVFGLDTHQLGNLTEERGRQIPTRTLPDVLGSLLEGSPFIPEFSNLVQKDPDLAGKSFREIIDISALDGSVIG